MTQTNTQKARDYSDSKISKLRGIVADMPLPPGSIVIIAGSLARREASEQSDIDYFVIAENRHHQKVMRQIKEKFSKLELSAPSPSGAFAKAISPSEFLEKIGGNGESNDDLTRRMVFLLESDWIYGEKEYNTLFDGVIERYIRDGITQHQLARFFLNDLIRYYRTICVDFEYKTSTAGKSWGDRNIKLTFSRKLLYFSGVVAVAATAQSSCDFKRSELKRLLRMPPLSRISEICGNDANRILDRYDEFIGWMSCKKTRELLKKTTPERKEHSDKFREMKNSGHHFSWELESLFYRTYAQTHPIKQALIL